MSAAATLPGTESQPHAAAILGPALPPAGRPSHAYLFHGPPGSGRRAVARAFATVLLSERSGGHVAERVARETHPDLTWVRPTGAAEMLVSDIDEPVVAAAAHTPFEASRRVFVIEGADTMNDRAANRLLKTLEEPPAFVHLILIAERQDDVLPTIVSRCQPVRFDPLPPSEIERLLLGEAGDGPAPAATGPIQPQAAAACARLALGDVELAQRLAGAEGRLLRDSARAFVAAAIAGEQDAASRPWSALLETAAGAGARASEHALAAVQAELELLPAKDRRRREREALEAARRVERRRRTRALDVGLRLVELWLRDLLCLLEGAPELIHAVDSAAELEADLATLRGAPGGRKALVDATELVCETRLSLAQNVSEELALEVLCYRLQSAIGPRFGVSP